MYGQIRAAEVSNPPAYLPPRRPSSLPDLSESGRSWRSSARNASSEEEHSAPPLFSLRCLNPRKSETPLVKKRPSNGTTGTPDPGDADDTSRPDSWCTFSSGDTAIWSEFNVENDASDERNNHPRDNHLEYSGPPTERFRLEPIPDGIPLRTALPAPTSRYSPFRPQVLRQSSLRVMSRPSDDDLQCPVFAPSVLGTSHSDPTLRRDNLRPYSHPTSHFDRPRLVTYHTSPVGLMSALALPDVDLWRLPPLPRSGRSTPDPFTVLGPRPRPSFTKLSSLDNLMSYREEKAEWRRARASSALQQSPSARSTDSHNQTHRRVFHPWSASPPSTTSSIDDVKNRSSRPGVSGQDSNGDPQAPPGKQSKFRHFAAEVGFCFTIAMTQFLAEYLISGFAIELPNIATRLNGDASSSMGLFWPAALLSLILSATLLIFARISDMYGGYFTFMFGVAWLAIWTLVPGFSKSAIVLDVSRAMQGLGIAAFTPSTFAMVGSIYSEGPRRNFVMGLYSGCAPLGFFGGFLVSGALPDDKPQWYFWIASILAAVTFITAFLTVPSDRTDRRTLDLKMDWIGCFLITSGLILIAYALSVEPYASQAGGKTTGFGSPIVIGTLVSGFVCLLAAFWYEGWCATCPLLPFDFFRPRSVKVFSVACLCFYASYGVWLYNSAEFFQSRTGTTGMEGTAVSGIRLALWYLPTAIGGIVLCIVGGSLMHIIPIMALLLTSAVAWIIAPLLLALAPLPIDYWLYVMPSMLCATIGIDLTFTISIVFLSSVQPLRYQGLSGAICSSLVNLAMSFALSISGIVAKKAENAHILKGAASASSPDDDSINWSYKAAFYYAAGSAGLGLIICVIFVRISRSVVREQTTDEERTGAISPVSITSTLLEEEGQLERT